MVGPTIGSSASVNVPSPLVDRLIGLYHCSGQAGGAERIRIRCHSRPARRRVRLAWLAANDTTAVPYTVVAVPDSFAQLDTEMTTLAGDVPAWQNDGIAVSQADPDPTGTISLSLATPTAAQLSALSRLGWLGRHLADDLLMDQSHQVDPTRSRDPAIGCLPVDLGQKILDEPGMPDDTALQLGAQSLGVGESRANGIANSVEPVEVEGKVLVQIQSVAIRSFVYGGRDLRQSIRERGTGYVLAVRSNYMVILPSGRRVTVKNAAGLVKPGMWQRMRTGSATKGARDYHWAMIEITPGDTPEGHDDGHAFLLLRRHRYTGTVSYFLCWSPAPVPLAKLICVAVASWRIEEDHQQSRQVSGLDSGQVTTWTSRHRWTAVSLLAHAFLAAAAACQRALDGSAGILGLLPVTVPELLRQLRGTIIPDPRRDKAHRDA
jgi:hypothetical protein